MNERTMNDLSGLVVVSHQALNDERPIQYYPGLFMQPTITKISVTQKGKDFLWDLYLRYSNNDLSVDEVLNLLNDTAEQIASGYRDEVFDKLFEVFCKQGGYRDN